MRTEKRLGDQLADDQLFVRARTISVSTISCRSKSWTWPRRPVGGSTPFPRQPAGWCLSVSFSESKRQGEWNGLVDSVRKAIRIQRPAILWSFSWSVSKFAQETANIIKLICHKCDACLRTSPPFNPPSADRRDLAKACSRDAEFYRQV